MLACINFILELIINVAIVFGILFLVIFYHKLKLLDDKIEKRHKEFEENRKNEYGKPTSMNILNGRVSELKRKMDEELAPIERERERIISKIPFLK
jgi:predicted Holliday junction resolvase-like endonuclease